MSEMVERVARAMHNKAEKISQQYVPVFTFATWEDAAESVHEDWLGIARAAFEALREPTEAMMTAPHRDMGSGESYQRRKLVWQTMIDAALK